MPLQTLKFARGFAIASVFALVTPAAGAGLVTAAAEGTMVMADVAAVPGLRSSYDAADGAPVSGPARLSPLAGSDETAWQNAKNVGRIVRPSRKRR